jgi:hypothetical protein
MLSRLLTLACVALATRTTSSSITRLGGYRTQCSTCACAALPMGMASRQEVDKCLALLGARRLYRRGEDDEADLKEGFDKWFVR